MIEETKEIIEETDLESLEKDEFIVENNLTFVCYENFTVYFDLYQQARFWIEGVVLIIVGILGLLGNILTLAVLSQSKRSTFNQVNNSYPKSNYKVCWGPMLSDYLDLWLSAVVSTTFQIYKCIGSNLLMCTMRTNLPQLLDLLIFCIYSLNFSLEFFIINKLAKY